MHQQTIRDLDVPQIFRKLGISSRVELARIAVHEQPPQEQGGLPERTPSYPNE